jgi:hypothetical protein
MLPSPSPWPRLRESWWVYALAGLAVAIFPMALVVQVRCGVGRCAGSRWERLLALDGLGGLPRLYISLLFAAVAVLAGVAARRSGGRARSWWTAVSGMACLLCVAKLVSAHSRAEGLSAVLTLVGGVAVTVLALAVLTVTGRRWGVAAARPVVLAFGIYAAAALGLDAVSALLVALQDGVGVLSRAATTFGEELGEAMSALFVLVTVRWQLPPPGAAADEAPPAPEVLRRSGSSTR